MESMYKTVKEVAKYLNLKEQKVRDLIKKGKLIAYRFDAEFRVNKYDIEEYVNKNKFKI